MVRGILSVVLAAIAVVAVHPAGAAAQNGEVPLCMGMPATIVGDGSGTISGTPGHDVIFADDGVAQVIYAGAGHDTICAGAGDIVHAGSGDDTVQAVGATAVYGESGDDLLIALASDEIRGGSGHDTLIDFGGSALYGDSGNDILQAGASCDGGSGRDTVVVACDVTVNVP